MSTRTQTPNIIHYLDDFLFAGREESVECLELSQLFQVLCRELGVPINDKKNWGSNN